MKIAGTLPKPQAQEPVVAPVLEPEQATLLASVDPSKLENLTTKQRKNLKKKLQRKKKKQGGAAGGKDESEAAASDAEESKNGADEPPAQVEQSQQPQQQDNNPKKKGHTKKGSIDGNVGDKAIGNLLGEDDDLTGAAAA